MTQMEAAKVVALQGDEAVAEAVRQCDVDVVAAYPITPQTIIVEKLAEFVATGRFNGEFVTVESEHSALSACLGASATGARVFTATSSQGLAYMHEMLYNVSGMRLPIVMAVANRALSAPLVLNADHSDMMGSRDSGWIQVYAENVEEIYDRTIQLFRLSEDPRVMLPSAINFEGFILSHDKERVRLLEDGPIRRFLRRPTTKHRLDPKEPFTFGAIATPDTYYEFRMQQAEAMRNALVVFEETEREFEAFSGRRYGAVDAYNTEGADRVVVVNGCTAGTMRAAARAMNAAGENVGVLAIKLYRPFPTEEVVSQLRRAKSVMTMDRSISLGAPSGPVAEDVKSVLKGAGIDRPVMSLVYGIGGRDVTVEDGKKIFALAKDETSFGEASVMYGVKA
ncbi:MAG: ferredoxin oxidoreductase [Nitrososphaerales archaeon]|jgi:pyruvate ferredoxin oxidoreductase alpha subunit